MLNDVLNVILIIGTPFVFGLCLGVTLTYINFMKGVNKVLGEVNEARKKQGVEPVKNDVSNLTVLKPKDKKED